VLVVTVGWLASFLANQTSGPAYLMAACQEATLGHRR
jgi:hypothetical protein